MQENQCKTSQIHISTFWSLLYLIVVFFHEELADGRENPTVHQAKWRFPQIWGVLFVGVLILRAIPFGVHILGPLIGGNIIPGFSLLRHSHVAILKLLLHEIPSKASVIVGIVASFRPLGKATECGSQSFTGTGRHQNMVSLYSCRERHHNPQAWVK